MGARLPKGAVERRTVTAADQAAGDTPGQVTVHKMLADLTPQLARAVGDTASADRLARIALTEVRKTPDLAECDRRSFAGALMTCAQLGLEPGPTGEAYLIPFRDRKKGTMDVTLIIGYQGMASLFWRHPMAAYLDAQVVYPDDDFDYALGAEPRLHHVPSMNPRDPKAKPVAYYAVARLTNGGFRFVVLAPHEVERHRQMGSMPNSPAWRNHYDEMGKKTCVRVMFKLLPKSTAIAQALVNDGAVRRDVDPDGIDVPEAIEGTVVRDPEPDGAGDGFAAPDGTDAGDEGPSMSDIIDAAEAAGRGEPDVMDHVAATWGPERDPASLSGPERARVLATVKGWQPPAK